MNSVDIETFKEALVAGAAAFDTRPHSQFLLDAIPGVIPLALAEVQGGEMPKLPKDHPIYLICEHGYTSELVGLYLEAAGFTHVFNVQGGMVAWRSQLRSP